MEPTLKAPGSTSKRLKLTYDKLLSKFASNLDLRRYIKEPEKMTWAGEFFATIELNSPFPGLDAKFDQVGFGLLFDPQSTSGLDGGPLSVSPVVTIMTTSLDTVGRCRSTVSRPVVKAPMVPALETLIS
jgi:hypothetical protein